MTQLRLAGMAFVFSTSLVFAATPSWAGTTGNGWSQPATPAVPSSTTDVSPSAGQQPQQPAQSVQTWVLHGKKVSCDSQRGWRHSEYVSHCGHG